MLNGTNFKICKENVMIILGCMGLNLALQIEWPPFLTVASTFEEKRDYEKWEY